MIQTVRSKLMELQKKLVSIRFSSESTSGLALFVSFLFLVFFSTIFDFVFSGARRLGVILSEIIAFGVPTAVLMVLPKRFPNESKVDLRLNWRGSKFHGGLWFTIKFAFMISFLSFLVNLLIFVISGSSTFEMSGIMGNMMMRNGSNIVVFLAVSAIPALTEEIFVRGALFSRFEQQADTVVCIVCSGLCFAMLHGSLVNFAGPFLAGCGYAFLTYSFRSIWPAVLAHAMNNFYYLVVNYLLNLYSTFGIWKYFTHISIILFLVSLYFTMRSLEYQIERRTLHPFVKTTEPVLHQIKKLLVNPGMALFAAVFLLNILFG